MQKYLWFNKLTNKHEYLGEIRHLSRLKILEIFKENDFSSLGNYDHLMFIKKIELQPKQKFLI